MRTLAVLPLLDSRKRPLRDLRISVTDRCNFRCTYCMPREVFGAAHRFLPKADILSFEEILRLARIFAALGVHKIRLTGGEPLMRSELPKLVSMLATIPDLDLTLTTNGALLERLAGDLADAGLQRITVSLDSLDPDIFRRMSDSGIPVGQVLRGIEAAERAGIAPIKINAVVRRGVNDAGIVDLARHFKGSGAVVRFIEFMDVGTTNRWDPSAVVSAREMVARIGRELPLVPISAAYTGEVARRYRYADGSGEIGFITSVSEPFCGDCSRARLSADGHLYTCLFAAKGFDLRPIVRSSAPDATVREHVEAIWHAREDRYSELRATAAPSERVEMSYIGG
jgi:cyclic pyranopterin phosphate synthase